MRSEARGLLAALGLVAGCTGSLDARDAHARPVPVAGGVGAVYLTLANDSADDDRLLGAESEACASIELHESREQDGIARMIPHPDGLALPAGSRVELRPGGHHLMLYGVRRPLAEGEVLRLRLRFERAGLRELEVPIGGVL